MRAFAARRSSTGHSSTARSWRRAAGTFRGRAAWARSGPALARRSLTGGASRATVGLCVGSIDCCGSMGVSGVAEVDPMDDTIWRWVIHHYRFDPERRQRRDVVVAAFDNAAELEAAVNQYHLEIQVGIDGGVRDDRERVTGVVWHPGYHSERARGRTLASSGSRPGSCGAAGTVPCPGAADGAASSSRVLPTASSRPPGASSRRYG